VVIFFLTVVTRDIFAPGSSHAVGSLNLIAPVSTYGEEHGKREE
jgi:hypothetical protein